MPSNLEQYIHRVGRTARAGRSGRSVTFATEQQRKLVREIVKNSKNSVKSRIIPSKVIDKYASKIAKIEPDIAKVVEEENAEREIAMLENRANRLQNELVNGPKDRAWIDKSKKKKKDGDTKKEAKGKKARKQRKLDNLGPDEREMFKSAEFQTREAKRARKPKRIGRMLDKPNQGFRNNKGNFKKKNK